VVSGALTTYYYPQKTSRQEVSLNVFRRLYFHDNGLLYSGRWSGGLYVFNPADKTNQPLPLKNDRGKHMLVTVGTSNMTRKSADEIWITTGLGLVVYNIKQQEITYVKENDVDYGLYYGIDFIDESQRAWLPVLKGVELFDPSQQQVVEYAYKGLRPSGESYSYYIRPGTADHELLLLPRNDDALYHFDLKTNRYKRVVLQAPGATKSGIGEALGFSKAPDGSYTLLGENGLFSYAPETGKIRPVKFTPPADFYDLRNIYWDRNGQLWMSKIQDAMYRWNPKTNQTRRFFDEFVVPEAPDQRPVVEQVWEDKKGQFWFRRMGGFSVYLPARDTMLNFLYTLSPHNTLPNTNWITEDHDGRIWISGPDGWLGYAESAHPEKGIVRKFNLREQLGLAFIYFMAVDHTGTLWGITSNELLYANTRTMEFHTLSFDYAGGEIDFFSLEYIPQGKIVIGGRSSLYVFDPGSMKRNTEMPKPYVEEILVKGKPLPTIPQVDGKPGLRLRYWENNFAVTFSAIAYTLGEKCRFRYRLRGQEDWQEAGNRRFVNYTNVPGGDYVFEVQVANNEGIWNPSILEMPI